MRDMSTALLAETVNLQDALTWFLVTERKSHIRFLTVKKL